MIGLILAEAGYGRYENRMKIGDYNLTFADSFRGHSIVLQLSRHGRTEGTLLTMLNNSDAKIGSVHGR